jgi:general secretion pathway protein K
MVDTLDGERKNILTDQRGMALLITVMTVSLLVAVTIMFHRKSWHSYLVAHNYKVNTELKAIGESGINIGLALLLQDVNTNSYDSLLDSWGVIRQNELNTLFGAGKLELEVVDLSGRLQINRLVQTKAKDQGENAKEGENNTEKEINTEEEINTGEEINSEEETNTEEEIRDILLQLLLSPSFSVEEDEAGGIVDALVDWIDEDERESDNGAESSYYQALKTPYECRNGPIQYIEELLLVRGIGPKLLFGKGEEKGLADYLTVYGEDGKININTADPLLLKSMNSQISDELAEELQAFRTDEENEEQLENPSWYSKIASWPGDIVLNNKLITTQSTLFLIRSVGRSDTLFRQVTAVVNRIDKKTIKVLSRKVE